MCYPWPEKIWEYLSSNISNLYCFNTVLHQQTLKWHRTTCKYVMLLPLSSKTMSFVRCRISLFSDESSHLLTDSNKPLITTYHNTFDQDCHSPLYNNKGKFHNSCIKQQWTVQHNFQMDVELHVPPINMCPLSICAPHQHVPPINLLMFYTDKNTTNYARWIKWYCQSVGRWSSLPHSGIWLLCVQLQLLWPWL